MTGPPVSGASPEPGTTGPAGRGRSLLKTLLIFLVLMTGPILCSIYYFMS